jgi:flagellar biosynthesis GTPase FlhF
VSDWYGDFLAKQPLTVSNLVLRFDREFPDSEAEWVATRAVRSVKAADRTALLASMVQREIESRRRDRARQVEHDAWKRSPQGAAVARDRSEHRKERKRYWEARDAEQRARIELEKTDPAEARRLYPTPWERFADAIQEFRAQVRLELTVELLSTTFALGDGRKTTWGRASVADHRMRMEMLTDQAMGTLETVVLHEKAIEMIAEHGVTCLTDVRFAPTKAGAA